MKTAVLLLSLPIAAGFALTKQDPAAGQQPPVENVAVMSLSELRYIDLRGKLETLSARDVVEIRVLDDVLDHVRFELVYDNGNYSLIDAESIHLLRQNGSRDVRVVRTDRTNMRLPRLP